MSLPALAVRQAERLPDPDYATAWLSAARWHGRIPARLLERRIYLDLLTQRRIDTGARRALQPVGAILTAVVARSGRAVQRWLSPGRYMASTLEATPQPSRLEWEDLLSALDDRERCIVDRLFWFGDRQVDIAAVLQVSQVRVSVLKRRALEKLRDRLA